MSSTANSQDIWVAGLNHGAHDSAAALLRNGEVVVIVEQERMSRRKRAIDEPPVDALRACLEHAGRKLEDLDAIALGSDMERLATWMGLTPEERPSVLPYDDPERLFPRDVFGDVPHPPVIPIRHHLAHAASTFWPSGFEEAAILVMDNRGEDTATTLLRGGPRGMETIKAYGIEHSLGLWYRIATQYAGLYSKDGTAGKLMGLASYGRPGQSVALRHGPAGPRWEGVPAATQTGRAMPPERTRQLLDYFARHCFPYTVGVSAETMAYADFAASVQQALEETILGLCQELHDVTGLSSLALAGGVALNCTANGRIAAESPFDEIFVQPMSHDGGVALGAALEASRELRPELFRRQTMRHAYWGPGFTDEEVAAALDERGLSASALTTQELAGRTAALLARGGVVGWCQGRGEVGPRALGARSLLGDPRKREHLVRINTLKGREVWRPLAPSVLRERYDDYFIGTPNPFMIVAAQVRPEMRAVVPAVVHVDGSARPQIVDADHAPRYAALLRAFERETGLPMVINTSLNSAGLPIANTPGEAVDMCRAMGADAVAVGSYLVTLH
ncbi:carbamoyltransferase C-terminal domain-containing protein [Streptomyces antimycoticus]|uniref:carbamoyltransferase family protein n=1 Tax=Streptomyces antimycoticus TaxID=68175 RepID=UPI00341C3FE3